jgi:RND superfamily putative drug exporter
VVHLRYLIIAGWVVAAVLATRYLPGPQAVEDNVVGTLIPKDAAALRTEIRSDRLFQVPLLARTVIVQRDPHGLSPAAQARAFLRAIQLDRHEIPALEAIPGALPLTNTLGLFPGSRESSTTALTYLYFDPSVGLLTQTELAQRYAATIDQPGDALVGVTGAGPARLKQGTLIQEALPWVEVATVGLIALIVGLAFRSVGAPAATLVAAAISYLVSLRVVTWLGSRLGATVPADLEPIIVVLQLGIVTDYSVFFLFGMRDRLRAGDRRIDAARGTTAEFAPIIVTAGLTVAAGTAALLVATLGFLRAFGPALALTVLIALVVSITFVPAVLATFGRAVFWPHWPARAAASTAGAPVDPATGPTSQTGAVGEPSAPAVSTVRDRLSRLPTVKPVALVIVVVVAGVLTITALGLRQSRLGFSLIGGLPSTSEESQAYQAAAAGFVPGIVSPTEVLIEGPGVGNETERLAHLETLIAGQPGVAGILGPREQPDAAVRGIMVTSSGDGARYLVLFDHDPLGGVAIADLRTLQDRMPALLREAGLGGATVGFAGDTALAEETVTRTVHDLGRIALATLLVDLVLLAVFLRALVAPLYLLAASVLALAASLGLTVLVFQGLFGHDDLTYYVPFAAAVLLVSLGSDYNIFIVGRMWDEAKVRPLRQAVATGARKATRPITIAGLTLALSFGLLAIVPVGSFREFAFAMFAGVLIDSFLVRPFLVPSLVSLFGRLSFWPGHPRAASAGREAPAGEVGRDLPAAS